MVKRYLKFKLGILLIGLLQSGSAIAGSNSYPAIRYTPAAGEALGGITLPLADEVGNALFNNPAALAKNTRFKAEILNLNVDGNSTLFSGIGADTIKVMNLGSMSTVLNSNTNQIYSAGYGNLTTLSWGGLGVGVLYQNRMRAYSDGTKLHYQGVNQFIPTAGYGLALARGVVRVGYSVQYVNMASGQATTAASNTQASYVEGVGQGHALSHTISGNIVFPFTYLPTISFVSRNILGATYGGSSLIASAKNPSGSPSSESMSVDVSLGFTVRVSGSVKTVWYFEYDDLTQSAKMPFLEKLRLGLDLQFSRHFGLKGGVNGTQFTGGLGYKSDSSEINLAMYHESTPFSSVSYWDTRYSLQYKVYLQDRSSRSSAPESGKGE